MRVRRAVLPVALGALLGAGPSFASSLPPLPVRDANQISTVLAVGGRPDDFSGRAYGPDVPLATVHVYGGLLGTEDCSYFLITPMDWTLDAGHGDVLQGQVVHASGGTFNGDPEVHLTLKVTGGTGRFAGWSGSGSYDALEDTDCAVGFEGQWVVNRV